MLRVVNHAKWERTKALAFFVCFGLGIAFMGGLELEPTMDDPFIPRPVEGIFFLSLAVLIVLRINRFRK